MAETDFGIIGATGSDVRRGVTAGQIPPNGGGLFVFGFNSQVVGAQAVGLYYNTTNFAPLRSDSADATGGAVRACLKRGRSVTPIGFSVGIFINLMGATTSDTAYILGLGDADPSPIVLAKAALIDGLPTDAANTKVLRMSSETYLWDTWHHLQLEAICNPNGDVVLKCKKSDLDSHPATAPNWVSIVGMDDYIDDSLAVASNSDPLAGGYVGFCFQSEGIGLRGYVDCFQADRQR